MRMDIKRLYRYHYINHLLSNNQYAMQSLIRSDHQLYYKNIRTMNKPKLLELLALLSLVLLCSGQLIKESKQQDGNIGVPKIPMYIGSSYHVLYGNPKSQYGLDPGFYHPVFEFSFTKNKTTEDQKFIIPDETTSHRMSTCSFTSEVSSFRGTQSYQQDLKKIAQVNIGSDKLLNFSFSLSRSWERLYNTTTVQKMSLTHATAQCQAYEIILDKFALPQLSNDFKAGAFESLQKGDWIEFIQEFGTHYVHQITLGGRATQQISYTYQSVSKLQSLDIDINIAAKANFAKFFADASFDWNKYSKSINYSEKIQTSKSQLYIGGQPPRTGNIYDWQAKIIDSPMPISYKLFPLSELFERITDIKFNSTKAVEQFQQALAKECDRLHCRPNTPDFPKPPPAYIVTQKTPLYGNTGGKAFDEFANSTTMQLRRVHIRSGAEIDNLQLFLSDGVSQTFTAAVGGLGGGPAIWDVPAEQFVNQIQFRSGDRIDSLTFITNKGNKSPKYGGTGGSYHLVNIPTDYRIVGFYGIEASRVQKLGFIIAKTIYPSLAKHYMNLNIQ